MNNLIIIVCTLISAFTQVAVYQKIVLGHPEAQCLDGTKGVYYLSKGSNPSKFVLFYEGGGWCGGEDLASATQSCYKQSFQVDGSSSTYPDQISFDIGIMSNSPSNPFADATKVYFKYCTGASHQGYRAAPLNYKGRNLYFKGHIVTQNALDDVEGREGLFSRASHIFITGQSAGGLAVFQWANYIRSKANAPNVFAISDSGIFLNAPTQSGTHFTLAYFQNMLKLSNVNAAPPSQECVNVFPTNFPLCMFAQNIWMHIHVPLFSIMSNYDSFSIPGVLGIKCLNGVSLGGCTAPQKNFIQQYHRNLTTVLQGIAGRPENGVWSISCSEHRFILTERYTSEAYRVPMGSSVSVAAALSSWINREPVGHVHMDGVNWPSNSPCSGA